MKLSLVYLAFCFSYYGLAASHHSIEKGQNDMAASSVQVIASFKNETWLENLALRPNGNILATSFDNLPSVYEINPSTGAYSRVVKFPQFRRDESLTGITPIQDDVFAFLVTQSRFDTKNTSSVFRSGPARVYTLSFTGSKPSLKLLTIIEKAGLPNGMSAIPGTKWILVGDSFRSLVYRVNSLTGAHQVVIRDKKFIAPAGSPAPIGINGIRVDETGKNLYFANYGGMFLGRVPITPDGMPKGKARIVAQLSDVVDDFALAGKFAYAATNPSNSILKVSLETGNSRTIAGNLNSTEVPGPTSAQFGTTKQERDTLYITCTGGLALPINGTYIEGGSLRALDLAKL